MTDEPEPTEPAVAGRADGLIADGGSRARARRRAAALGDLVPQCTGEELRSGEAERDQVPHEHYLRDVPPHHG